MEIVTVQPRVFPDIQMFLGGVHRGASFVCLPAPMYTFYFLTYRGLKTIIMNCYPPVSQNAGVSHVYLYISA